MSGAPLWTLADVVAATGAVLHLPSPGTGEGGGAVRAHASTARRMRDSEPGRSVELGASSSPVASRPVGLATPSSPVPGEGSEGPRPVVEITGISIDTRTLEPGELFVALQDLRDGHDFVTAAFAKGASVALVKNGYIRKDGDGCLLRVADPLEALVNLGRAARARVSPDARVIAVTGSAGKTTTKEMLRACLSAVAPGQTHASEKSYNNHWGVPLTLARMPADTMFAVFEIGMNHAGEITPLTKMVRPHVAIITTVAAVHLEHFGSVEEIARAKAEIALGLEPGGVAILPGNNPHYPLLAAEAQAAGAEVVSFGIPVDLAGSTMHVNTLDHPSGPQTVWVNAREGSLFMNFAVGMRGLHMALNATAVVLALDMLDIDPLDAAVAPLAGLGAGAGRGQRTVLSAADGHVCLIDESYNANPASMRAALDTMALTPRGNNPRRIAVLGDMLELGPDAPRLHAELASAIESAGVDLVFACGPNMRHLYDAIPTGKRGTWAETSAGLEAALLAEVRGGDVVMIKGSNGSKMALLVSALKQRFGHIPAKTGI
jgi:UDP-N-acetylmuramoyl-tripeptide--D-alanyl-D-alanine ligase